MNPAEHSVAVNRLLSQRVIVDECWEWAGKRSDRGYGSTKLNGRWYRTHRLAASLWLGFDIDSDLFVCHHCDNPPCFNPDHLFVGDAAANVRDMDSKGRRVTQRGEESARSKLTEYQVEEIKRRILNGEPRPRLAVEFGVARATLDLIAHGKNWAHVRVGGRSVVTAPQGMKVKLTDEDVNEIRRVYAAREATQYELASIYGVTQSHISSVVSGRRRAA